MLYLYGLFFNLCLSCKLQMLVFSHDACSIKEHYSVHQITVLTVNVFSLCSGYEGLIKNLMSEFPEDLVTYDRPVQCVHWNNILEGESPVIVECHDGEKIVADHVIVTVSLGNFNPI